MKQTSAPESLEQVASDAVKSLEEFYQTKTVSLAHFQTPDGDTFKEVRSQHLSGVSATPNYTKEGKITGGTLTVEKEEFPESYKTLQTLAKDGKIERVGLFKLLLEPAKYPTKKTVQQNPRLREDIGPNLCQR
jgi:hypothetical protein